MASVLDRAGARVPTRTATAAARGLTRDVARSRRKRAVRPRTISVQRMPKRELRRGLVLYPEAIEDKPKTRADCVDGFRPCPYVSCKFNLYLDVSQRTGAIKLNFPDLDPDELVETCCLDIADRGPHKLEDVAEYMSVTRERIRQLEQRAISRLQRQAATNPVTRRFLAMWSE